MAAYKSGVVRLNSSDGQSTGDTPIYVQGMMVQGIQALFPQTVSTGESSPTPLMTLATTMDYTYFRFRGGRKFPHGLSISASGGVPELILFLA